MVQTIFVRVNMNGPSESFPTKYTIVYSTARMNEKPLCSVQNLQVSFNAGEKTIYAVRGISFQLFAGESVGIVGESGCGKTTAVQAIAGLLPKAKILGSADFDGIDLFKESKKVLGRKIGMVFQDPMTSLNPTMRIGFQIEEALIYHKLTSKKMAREKALELLKLVAIADPLERFYHYPHQFSGGQRQRIAIAIALACSPKLLIADEPTTALDTTIQAQVIKLIQAIQKQFHMALLLISHDLGVIAQVCHRILVFYAGKIVEEGFTQAVLSAPKHPYTRMLLEARPRGDFPKTKPLRVIEGSAPSLTNPIQGCSFLLRCPFASVKCQKEPPLSNSAACWEVS